MNAFLSSVGHYFETAARAEYDIQISQFPRHAVQIVRRCTIAAEPELIRVYAVGGDGILFDCLNGIAGLPNAELAPVPCGHTNDFVRAFGEGLEGIFRNIPLLAEAPAIPTDMLYCGGNYALNLCTVGLESAAAFRAGAMQKNLRSWPRFFRNSSYVYNLIYYLGGFMVMFDKKTLMQEYNISIDGEDLSGAYAGINIANGPCYGGDKSAVVTAVPDDGFMDILMFKGNTALRGLRRVVPYTKGHYHRFPGDFTMRRGKIISIRSADPLMINLDGEMFLDTNITVELITGAVKIAAPNNISYRKTGSPAGG
jgi:diacylglycerol kinase family enzyme